MRILNKNEKVKFLNDGNLLVDNGTHFQIYESGFCIENFLAKNDKNDKNDSFTYVSAFLCINQRPAIEQKKLDTNGCSLDLTTMNRTIRFWLTTAGFVSIFFLLLTTLFYITLPDLKNFQGRIVCAYIFSIVLKTILLIVVYNVKLELRDVVIETGGEFFIDISELGCQVIGHTLYFAGILMFCWMSVLCLDLFWTFVCTPIQLQNKKHNSRMFLYFASGFGIPLVMTFFVCAVDNFKLFQVRPEVGVERCFLSANGARYYFNIPVMSSLAFNTVIFIITTFSLWKSFRENKIAMGQHPSQRVQVFLNIWNFIEHWQLACELWKFQKIKNDTKFWKFSIWRSSKLVNLVQLK